MKPSNHTVLITGGNRGIGLALAAQFHKNNNRVIITGRNPETLEKARLLLPGLIVEQSDLNNTRERIRISQKFKDVNLLINNAGIQHNYQFAEDPQRTKLLIQEELITNLEAPLHLTSLFLPHLIQKKEAAIINITSGLALQPKASAPIYCATKAALRSFSISLRYQLEKSPVRVFEVLPPIVDTAMTAGRGKGKISPEELAEEFWKSFLMDRTEIRIGKVKLLHAIQRFMPSLAAKIMKKL